MLEFRGKQQKKATKKREITLGKLKRDLWSARLTKGENKENVIPECGAEVIIKNDHDYSCIDVEDVMLPSTSGNDETYESHYESTPLLGPTLYTPKRTSEDYAPKSISKMSSALSPIANVNITHPTTSDNKEGSNMLSPNKKRLRKINVQRQGLEYIKEYDKEQSRIKVKQQELDEKRISLEERKLELDQKKFMMEEFKQKKHIELLEQMLQIEKEHRRELSVMIERQEKLINILISERIVGEKKV